MVSFKMFIYTSTFFDTFMRIIFGYAHNIRVYMVYRVVWQDRYMYIDSTTSNLDKIPTDMKMMKEFK